MRTETHLTGAVLALVVGASGLSAQAQAQAPQAPAAPQPYTVGNPLGLPVRPAADGKFDAISPQVKVFGSVYSAESCSYDPVRGLIVIPNRGVNQTLQSNNAWITLMNHDGSIHTPRWVGVQTPGAQRDAMTPKLVLNEPFGSEIVNGVLYLADRDGGTTPADPMISVIRRFDMSTGAPLPDIVAAGAPWFNDIAVAADGSVYATATLDRQVWRVMPNGQSAIFVQGAPLARPNGIGIDGQGNIVVVNMDSPDVLTFSPSAALLRTEQAAQSGNDGLVIRPDGTKYVSSVLLGGLSRLRPGQPAELIAQNIPNAASMCYDSGANQLVIPMNDNNAIALVKID